MASSFYPKVFKPMLEGTLDLRPTGDGGDTVKVMLLNSNYTFSVDHKFVSDITALSPACELQDGVNGVLNYSRKTVPVTLAEDLDPANEAGCHVEFALTSNAQWGTDPAARATFTVRHAVMFVQGTTDADSHLLYYFDLASDQTVSSGTFSLISPATQPKIRRQT